ncbi:DUF4169 family protein [Aureimonas frigidaquae]|uniref:DUF4169 family protein n=1 Tax=Aureimonas frigidaquae TaxID=424757 RepID=UPI000780AD5F|nr:DUF4169 family protein [Aureimonas frigidaquae]
MGDVVNLRMARKNRQRQQAAQDAEQNRVTYGLSRKERAKAGSERETLLKQLDGARLDKPATAPDPDE